MNVATRADIAEWLNNATQGTTHMLVVCDTFSWEDYPVYVSPEENVLEILGTYHEEHNMQRVMEVYRLDLPFEAQLNEHRAWHVEA